MSRIAALLLLLPLAAVALEDPMRPPMPVAPRRVVTADEGFALTSTYIARERRAAVINGKTVAVGDHVGEAKVIEILPTQARLQLGDKDFVVRLLPVSVKTPAKTEEQEHQ